MKVEYLDHMGDDLAVVNAARVSYAKHHDIFWEEDEALIRYLANHDHWTPFSHTAIKLRVGAPVPIRTQCFKHKIGMVENEESRRYIKTTPEIYLPEEWRRGPEEGQSKQGSGGVHPNSNEVKGIVAEHNDQSLRLYNKLIATGICPEQARFVLPQGAIVNWIWTGNLVSLANFYKKRTHHEAQKEIQELAYKVGEIVEPLFPVSWKELTSENK